MELRSSLEQEYYSSKKITVQEHEHALTQLNIEDISKHKELLVLLDARAISSEEFFEKLDERSEEFYRKMSQIQGSR